MCMDVPSGKAQPLRMEDEHNADSESDSEPGLESEPEAGVPFGAVLWPSTNNLLRGEPLRPLMKGLEPEVPFCDAYPAFEALGTAEEILPTHFLADGHPSPAGQRVMAQAVAAFLRERNLLPE